MSKDPKFVRDSDGKVYSSIGETCNINHLNRPTLSEYLNTKGYYIKNNKAYCFNNCNTDLKALLENHNKSISKSKVITNVINTTTVSPFPEGITENDVKSYIEYTSIENLPFVKYDFKSEKINTGFRYAIALFSDAHIEETVKPSSVLGLNEYNVDIAEKRIENYFKHLAICLEKDGVDTLLFASLGDTISGFIHDELAQTNGLSPLEAIYKAQNIIYNGMRYLINNTNISKIIFVGICGNHSRVTKKIQHSNGTRMSYEWLMYKNIKDICDKENFPIEFCLPESEMAIIDMPDKKRYIFLHGFQIKSSGTNTVCGIYPSLNRLSMKYDKTFHQDKMYIGHFHSCVSIPNAVVNGSIIGYTSYSLSNGFPYEEPAQMYQVFDSIVGEVLTRKIYCK